jgi:hypothetical protein
VTMPTRLRSGEVAAVGQALAIGAVVLTVLAAFLAVFVHPLVAVALTAGCLAAPLVLRDFEVALLAVVAVTILLPFGAIGLGLGFNPTYLDLALLALYLVAVVRLAMRQQTDVPALPLSAAMLLFIGLLVVALLNGTAQGMPNKNQLRTFAELLLAAGLFFVVGMVGRDRRSVRRLFLAIVALSTLASLIGVALYLLPDPLQVRILSLLGPAGYPTGPQVLRFINDDPHRLQRATGTAIDPNSFGGMLVIAAALVLPQLATSRPVLGRRYAAAALGILVAALAATVSRGSIAGLMAAVVVVGLARDRRVIAAGAVTIAALLGLARVVPWLASFVQHFAAGSQIADRATQMRVGEYKDAILLIRRYPLFGVGFGEARDVDLYRGVSSLYLIIAETMGLTGLLAFLGLSAAMAHRMLAGWRGMAGDELRPVLLGCLAALAAALTSGLFDHYFFTYPHALALLCVLMGLAMSIVRLARLSPSRRAPDSRALV